MNDSSNRPKRRDAHHAKVKKQNCVKDVSSWKNLKMSFQKYFHHFHRLTNKRFRELWTQMRAASNNFQAQQRNQAEDRQNAFNQIPPADD